MASSSLSLLMAKSASAQSSNSTSSSIPTPSVPEFTVKFVDSSYDVPTTTSIDPYSGQSVTNQGYHVENRTIELLINNQPYSSYEDSPGSFPFFYYNVREKGQFAENWTEIYNANNVYLLKSNSDFTVASYSLEGGFPFWNGISSGQVDFQVEALVGGIYRISPQFASGYEFNGVTSGWSNTQTVTVPASTSSSSTSAPSSSPQNSTPSPASSQNPSATSIQSGAHSAAPQLNWVEIAAFAVVGIVVALLIVVIALMRRRIQVLELKQNGVKEKA